MAIGSFAVLPRYFRSTRSPSWSFCASASFGLIHALGSHVILVSGLGSSCSQPLLAKRPSHTVGSGRKMISSPDPAWLLATGDWLLLVTGDWLLGTGDWLLTGAAAAV